MNFLQRPTRNLFFTGKGGVGKTSLACATALSLAERSRKVLLVSTDPASNLDEVLGTELGQQPTPVVGVPNLWALNLDPEAAAREYRERMVGPYRHLLPEAAVASMEEQFVAEPPGGDRPGTSLPAGSGGKVYPRGGRGGCLAGGPDPVADSATRRGGRAPLAAACSP
jgi:Anion-transporting ATPase